MATVTARLSGQPRNYRTGADTLRLGEPWVVNQSGIGTSESVGVVVLNTRGRARCEQLLRRLVRPPLRGAGLVMLCETPWRTPRSSWSELAAELAARLEMSFVFVPEWAAAFGDGAARWFKGVALLSAEPFEDVRAIELPGFPFPRHPSYLTGAPHGLAAKVRLLGRPITVGVAHLNSRCAPEWRARQMERYLTLFSDGGPAIIGGDWNTTTTELGRGYGLLKVAGLMARRPARFRHPQPYEPLFEMLAQAGFETDRANRAGAPTFTFNGLVPRILRPHLDWIALRGLDAVPGSAKVVAARNGLLARRFTDHDFVACEVARPF